MKTRKPLSIIDTISFGFLVIRQHLWLVVVPILLDLLLWLGPRLSVSPLFEEFAAALAALPQGGPDPAIAASTQEMLALLADRFNLLSLLVVPQLGMPSLLSNPQVAPVVDGAPIVSGWGAAGLALLLGVLGIAVATLWLGLVARAVRAAGGDQSQSLWAPAAVLRHGLRHSATFLILILLACVALVAILAPLSIAISLVGIFVGEVVALALWGALFLLLGWGFIWLAIHLYFVAQAVALHNAGPVQALWQSLNVVGRNFWSAFGLILLLFVINSGMGIIWEMMAASPVGLVLAVVGNAFVGTGLLAAIFIFFADRFRLWQQQSTTAAAEPPRSRA